MKIIKEFPDGLKLIKPDLYYDNRGYFFELYRENKIKKLIKSKVNFYQDNVSYSKKNVFRGFHFQKKPYQQGKLVTVLIGEIEDYAINLNKKSKYFLKSYKVKLNNKNGHLFWIPKNFAHGFLVKSNYAIVHYKVTNYYNPKYDSGINCTSKIINFNLTKKMIISKKDKDLPMNL